MNSSTNHTNSSFIPSAANCRIWKEEYHQENYISTLAAIILNMITCPMTIFVNLLVIIAVKTKRRLQNSYNILLACLAATDLVVGAIVQPSFIVGELFLITGATLTEYCTHYNRSIFLFVAPCLASLHLLALLSTERYVVMKYSLRYQEIITNFRLTVGVITCWITAVFPLIFITIAKLPFETAVIAAFLACLSLLAIIYCHISVYFVTRRHMHQIKTEQVSQDALKKFLEGKKAAVTTSIIIGFVLFSFVPSTVYKFVVRPFPVDYYFGNLFTTFKPLVLSFNLVNSLCNPIIYCWRSSVLRRAFYELLRRTNNAG